MSFGHAVALAVERIVDPVEGMHRAISGRWFSALGDAGKPAKRAHDTVTHGIYQAVRLGGTALGVGIDYGATVRQSTFDRTQALVNGLWGDTLGRYEERLGIPMSLRDRDGAMLTVGPPLDTSSVTSHLVVLVHGFIDTEHCWTGSQTDPGLLDALESHPSLTPLQVRYNTGQPVSVSGAELADLIETVSADWPAPVESIALVGHSMGGLVIRSACAAATENGHDWITVVTDVVALGAPHLGTPLEKLTELAARGLVVAKETRPLARFLDSRSRGIKDLRHGTILAGDWSHLDPVALPTEIDHHFVAGVVTAEPTHPAGIVMGDLVVRTKSATGADHLDPTNVMVVGGVRHTDLVRDPAVINRVMGWLG
jgi:triacylglycerol esterase/lipase EstA (alpha/beta hydrolase family)